MLLRGSKIFGSLVAVLMLANVARAFPPHRPSQMPQTPPPAGSFVHSSMGTYSPATGLFTPGTAGASTIVSRKDIFSPTTGTFVPSSTGAFFMKTREAIDPTTGKLIPSATGPYSLSTQGNFTVPSASGRVVSAAYPTTSGLFVHTTTGAFNATTGTFSPAASGASTLSSGRDIFVPSSGTFVPAKNGAFTLTTREAYNPNTGTFYPSATGQYVLSTRGTFNSATPGTIAMSNDSSARTFNPTTTNSTANMPMQTTSSPWTMGTGTGMANNGVFSQAPFNHMVRRYERELGREQMMLGAYGTGLSNGYVAGVASSVPYSNPYVAGAAGGYPYAGSAYSGYGLGAGYGGSAPIQNSATASIPPYNPNPASTGNQQPGLAAFNVPNDGGNLQWPLAFRLMPPDKKTDLLDKLGAQMKIAANQAAGGTANPLVLKEAKETLEHLKQWLRDHQTTIAENTYEEGQRFLRRIDMALQKMGS